MIRGSLARRRQQSDDLIDAIEAIRTAVPDDDRLRELFMRREFTAEFENIGRIATRHRRTENWPPHLIVWEGFEYAIGRKLVEI